MRRGLDWYKRDPIAFLGGVQGMTAKQIAVYTITLDLIYQHGGEINNDAGWISGWIKDMGSASVRRTIDELCAMNPTKLIKNGDKITQKRAENEAKTRQKLSENRAKIGKKGGENSSKSRSEFNEYNDLDQANASSKIQADKRREEKDNNTILTRARERYPTIDELCEAAGITDETKSPGLLSLSEPMRWVDGGCIGADIKSALNKIAARGKIGRTWTYYSDAVFAERDTRVNPPPPVKHVPSKAQTGGKSKEMSWIEEIARQAKI